MKQNRSQRKRQVVQANKSFRSPAGIKNRVLGANERINARYVMILDLAKDLTDEKLAEIITSKKWDGKSCSSTDMATLISVQDKRKLESLKEPKEII
jgi:hypothetical protein